MNFVKHFYFLLHPHFFLRLFYFYFDASYSFFTILAMVVHSFVLIKNNLFCSHKKKRAKQVKKYMQRGLLDPDKVDAFSLFVESTNITYCLYKDSERVLGNTFGVCILQVLYFMSLINLIDFCF